MVERWKWWKQQQKWQKQWRGGRITQCNSKLAIIVKGQGYSHGWVARDDQVSMSCGSVLVISGPYGMSAQHCSRASGKPWIGLHP